MTKSPRSSRRNYRSAALAQRVRVLDTLIAICRSLEELQKSADGRAACRHVAQRLRHVLDEEKVGGVVKAG
jgi:hypothetical protein